MTYLSEGQRKLRYQAYHVEVRDRGPGVVKIRHTSIWKRVSASGKSASIWDAEVRRFAYRAALSSRKKDHLVTQALLHLSVTGEL